MSASGACGIYDCGACAHSDNGSCSGCFDGNAQLCAAGAETCAVYTCVQSAGIGSCSDCSQPSCVLRRAAERICPLRARFEKKRWWAGHVARALEGRVRQDDDRISEKVVSRLRWYLAALEDFAVDGQESVSSWQLAERVGVNSALIRKDLSRFGDFGTPSFGYRTDYLIERLRGILRLDVPRNLVWIGACSFRQMSAAVGRLCAHGCNVIGVFDTDPAEIGGYVGEHRVCSVDDLREFAVAHDVHAAALVANGIRAQEIAAMLDEQGVRAILNLSGQLLVLPDRVKVSNIDVAGELLELCYYADRPTDPEVAAADAGPVADE